jgi:hypothetical protein
MRLNARLSDASSSSFSPSGTRAARSPPRICSAPDRHRSDQEQQRHHQENQGELDLRTGPLTFQLLVLGGSTPVLFDVIQNPWLDEPTNIEIDVVAELVEANECSHPIVTVIGHDGHVAPVGKAHLFFWNRLEAERE